MKSLFLGLGIVVAMSSVQAQELQTRGGQGSFVVKSAAVVDLDQNQSQCEFQVSIADFNPDMQCAFGPSESSCESDILSATFVAGVENGECTVTVGQEILSTTDQYYSTTDVTSPGLFTWITLNAGYTSLLMYPNYGK